MKFKIKKMGEMIPCEIGRIKDSSSLYDGDVVMRTASTSHFEVMNLSGFGEDRCWINTNFTTKIEIFPEEYIIGVILR